MKQPTSSKQLYQDICHSITDEEFSNIVKECRTYTAIINALGFDYSSTLLRVVKKRIESLNLSTSHFTAASRTPRQVHKLMGENFIWDEKLSISPAPIITGIYMFTNIKNNKKYIGQSSDVKHRCISHWTAAYNPQTCGHYHTLERAIRKYGASNFKIDLLIECSAEELNHYEKIFISQYDSYNNGYNETAGGDANDWNFNEKINFYPNGLSVLYCIYSIRCSNMSFSEIGQKWNCSTSNIYRINSGAIWKLPFLKYPLRDLKAQKARLMALKQADKNVHNKQSKKANKTKSPINDKGTKRKTKKTKYCIDCHTPILSSSTRCPKCDILYRQIKAEQRLSQIVSKEQLLQLIRVSSFEQIGKQFGVSGNTIKKWCKTYNLPSNKNVINLISNEEWHDIAQNYLTYKNELEEKIIQNKELKTPEYITFLRQQRCSYESIAKIVHMDTKTIKQIIEKCNPSLAKPQYHQAIYCKELDLSFNSETEAARYLQEHHFTQCQKLAKVLDNVNRVVNGKRKSYLGLHFVKL